jgi:peptidoglycan/LPS O-acetylase OafA/YrhL
MKDNTRLPSLDGWRGIAILMVIIGHEIMYRIQSGLLPQTSLLSFFAWHVYGVQAFFVISGFIITWLLIKEENTYGRISLKGFYLRRFLRIVPPLFAYLFILFLLAHLFPHKIISKIVWFKAIFFLTNFMSFGFSWNTLHLWSLAIEEQYYLFWPVIFRIRKLSVLIAVLFICIAPILRVIEYRHPGSIGIYSFFIRSDSIFIGALFALYNNKIKAMRNTIIEWLILAATVLCVLAEKTHVFIFSSLTIPFCISFFSLSVVILIKWSMVEGTLLYRFLNNRPLVWIGKISYGLYLWQQLFYPYSVLGTCIATRFPFNFICMFLCAFLSYQFIEKPVLKLRKKIMERNFIQQNRIDKE